MFEIFNTECLGVRACPGLWDGGTFWASKILYILGRGGDFPVDLYAKVTRLVSALINPEGKCHYVQRRRWISIPVMHYFNFLFPYVDRMCKVLEKELLNLQTVNVCG